MMQVETKIPVPALDEISGVAESPPSEEDLLRQFTAALIAITSLLMGVIGSFLFDGYLVGINAFLYIGLCLLVAFGLLVFLRRPIVRQHAIFAIPAILFALLLSVRLAPQLLVFNTLAIVGSLLIVIHFTGSSRFLGGHWLNFVEYVIETMMIGWFESLRVVVPDTLRWFGRAELDGQRLANMRSVLRGLLITMPIVGVFALLLSSADAVFGRLAERVVTFFLPESAAGMIEQMGLIIIFAVIFLTACWTMATDRRESSVERMSHEKPRRFRLNMIETSIVFGSVDFLFLAFVIIQARYFFGGEANITTQSFTYAEYARRGFYEMLAVSCMTVLLLVTMENLTHRKREEENIFRGLVGLMVALTFVILIAASQRLNLYENAYGYTRIRVMSGTFMVWLAVLLGILLIAILRHRNEVFWIGCIVAGMGFILTLNVINMDGFIASHNIARFEATGKLDTYYLVSLSDDAMPAVSSLINNPDLEESDRKLLLRGLGRRLAELDHDREARGPFSFHIGKARAWKALNAYRDILSPYISSRWP